MSLDEIGEKRKSGESIDISSNNVSVQAPWTSTNTRSKKYPEIAIYFLSNLDEKERSLEVGFQVAQASMPSSGSPHSKKSESNLILVHDSAFPRRRYAFPFQVLFFG